MRDPGRFWDRWAARYARMPVPDEASYRTKLAATQARFIPETELFEFGCGTGSTAIAHAPHVAQVLAIDVSPRMLEIARGKAAAAGLRNVTFQKDDIASFDAGGRLFDMVLGLSILHLLPDPAAGVARARALLRPGGLFVTSTIPLADLPLPVRAFAFAGASARIFPPLRFLTVDGLVSMMERQGLTIVHRWQPGPRQALFLMAQLPGTEARLRPPPADAPS